MENSNNYFEVINGIKYDINQSTELCSSNCISKSKGYGEYKKEKWTNKEILIKNHNNIFTKNVSIRKGINGNYFLYISVYTQFETTDEINQTIEIGDNNLDYRYIVPITRDDAIQYYFNGYYSRNMSTMFKMTPLVSEEEAFEGIPIA
jgi:hypothetical protein